jgi:secreted trypsin-like serine protease
MNGLFKIISQRRAKKNLLLFCLLAFLLRVSAQEHETFIVGGSTTPISSIPFQVSIEISGSPCTGSHGCGGSILNSEWIVTAAHCVDGSTPPSFLMIHAGSTDQSDNSIGQRVGVDQIIIHPDWIPSSFSTVGNDIALLHLAQPLCFNQDVQPVAFADSSTPSELIQPGAIVTISGWGRTVSSNSGDCAILLQSTQLPIIDNDDAGKMFENCSPNSVPVVLPPTMLSFFDGTTSAAGGDSGGPAFVSHNGLPLLVGITSWGCGINTTATPVYYTSVKDFADFISSSITQASTNIDITANTKFESDLVFNGDITVKSGVELIIESTIGMAEGKKIIVERNARLVIDNGGIVTKGCNAPWAGIQVLGNNQKAQPERNAPLTDPDQAGIVWIDNGTVEWARCGVSAGGGHGAEFWGGLVWTNNSIFRNNRKDVEFMSYKFSPNKSRFNSSYFFELDEALDNTEGITIWETDGIEINRCHFTNKDQQGIRSYDASFKVTNRSKFINNQTGIAMYATYPMVGKTYIGSPVEYENSFTDNQYHIHASTANGLLGLYNPDGRFSVEIVNNNFQGGQYGAIVDGPSNFRIGGNKFTGVRIGTWTANTGYNNAMNQNLIGCNLFDTQRNIGILAIGDNKQMQFLGNDLVGGAATARDFVLTSSLFPGNNGAIRAMQGNPDVPAGNCFGDPGNQPDIVTAGQWGGTTDFFTYYYEAGEPSVDCDPEPVSPGNYGKTNVFDGVFTIDCAKFGGLPTGLQDPKNEDLDAKRQQLQALAPSIQTDANARAQYYQILAEKEAVLKYLVDEALEEKDFVAAETLLAGEGGKAAQWAIFGLRVGRQDYAGASELLNQLPVGDVTDAQFRDIQTINLQRLQNPTDFELSAEQEGYLNSVADGYSPIRGYARGILGLLKNRVYFPDEYEITEERSSPTERIATDALKIYPVPASDQLVVTWPHLQESADAQIQVFDLLGRSHLSAPLGAKETTRILSVASLPNGVYFLTVSDKGKVAYRTKFIVQH